MTNSIDQYDYNDNNLEYFRKKGFVIIASTALRYPLIGVQEAINAGCALGATVMLYKHEYAGNVSGNAVIPFYISGGQYTINSQTNGSYSGTGNASFYSNNGYGHSNANVSGQFNSNTTTTVQAPGSFSYYTVPYSRDYYDQYVVFMAQRYFKVYGTPPLIRKRLFKKPIEITTINSNDWIQVIHQRKHYYKIKYNGKRGLVRKSAVYD